MYLYYTISGLFNALASTLLGFLVYRKNKNNKANKLFSLLCFGFAAWSFPYSMWPLAKSREETLFWFQVLHFGAIFIPIFYYHFVLIWLEMMQIKKRILLYFGYGLAIFFCFFVFSPLFIADMVPKFSMKWWAEPGIMYYFYLIYFFFFYFYASILLLYGYFKSEGLKRSQIKFILIGLVIAIAGGSTNYILWFNINIPPYGNIFASTHVFLGAYAIIQHRLLDIKFVLRKSSVYLTSLFSILILSLLVQFIFIYSNLKSRYIDFFILILSISLFSPIKHYFYRLANRYFFTSLYDAKQVIADLSDKLRKSLELKKIYGYTVDILMSAFHSKSLAVFIFDEKKQDYAIKFEKGFAFGARKKFSEDELLHSLFVKQNNLIIIEELKNTSYKKYKKEIDLLVEMKIEIMMPLNVKDRNIGLIVLGPKESGDMYNDEDLQVLQIVGAQAAIAVENALSYERVKYFNAKLKKEVEEATADLRAANKKLMELDESKSEFISIASHQLRTPLTVIKGYISMMLEGSFGPLTDQELESLKKVFESNERLIQLVENLLDISRIESGRLEFNFKEERLEKVVESVIEELKGSAEQKGLRLEYKKPAKPLPMVKFDEQKIRQVIMNLVDNAVKYTKQGNILVEIGVQGKNIIFSVADTGMGVSHDDLPNLFMKFSRGKGVSLVHTGGSGLGLYVGRMMIEAHRGKIWGESAGSGKGAKFCFSLPIRAKLKSLPVKKAI